MLLLLFSCRRRYTCALERLSAWNCGGVFFVGGVGFGGGGGGGWVGGCGGGGAEEEEEGESIPWGVSWRGREREGEGGMGRKGEFHQISSSQPYLISSSSGGGAQDEEVSYFGSFFFFSSYDFAGGASGRGGKRTFKFIFADVDCGWRGDGRGDEVVDHFCSWKRGEGRSGNVILKGRGWIRWF